MPAETVAAAPVAATTIGTAPPWQVPLSPATRRHLARLLIGDMADIEDDDAADPPAPAAPPPAPGAADPLHDLAAALPVTTGEGETGLRHLVLSGFPWPLWLRAGTRDAEVLHRTIATLAEALPVPFAPRRILDLGAGFGYRAVALAASYPEATIAAAEVLPRAWRLLSLNTLPWRQISPMRLAVAAEDGACSVAMDAEGRARLVPARDATAHGAMSALALDALYRRLGWDHVDLLVVDPAQVAGLEAPAMAAALGAARMVAIARPDSEADAMAAVAAALPEASHVHRRSPEYGLFIQRRPAAPLAPPRRISLVDFAGSAARIAVSGMAGPIQPLGDSSVRLMPERPDVPARITVSRFLAGPRRFEAGLRAGGGGAGPMRFSLDITAEPSGRRVVSTTTALAPGAQESWQVDLPMFFGDARITIGVDAASVGQVADWLDPGFL